MARAALESEVPTAPRPRRAASVLRTMFAVVLSALCAPAAVAQDPPAGPAAPPVAPPATPPADPAREQALQDVAAEDALRRIWQPSIVDVMAGLELLARVRSTKATTRVLDVAVERTELHAAEFAGAALAACDPEGALDDVEKRLRAPGTADAKTLRQLAAVLAFLPAPRAPKLLASDRLLGARDESVRRAAIFGLGLHRSPLGFQSAVDALSAKDPGLRNVACAALGRIGDRRAVTPLLSCLDKTDGGTAGFAAIALGRIEDESILNVLAQTAGQGNSIDKGKAIVAAARPAHGPRLRAMLKSGSSDAKIAACAALAKIADHDVETQKELLGTMLGDSDRWVRSAAFHALGRCATTELSPHLARRMGQQDEERQMYVYEIAGDLAAKECVPTLEAAAWAEKNSVLRRVAMDAFWRCRDADAIAGVEDKIRKATGKSWDRAMEFLSMRRNRRGFDLALELLQACEAGSHRQFMVELAIERQTGHFFGPDVSVWNEWIGKNPKFFEREQAAIERAKWREDFLKENQTASSTSATETSVQLALDYLARHQDPSGAFDQQHFLDLCAKPGCPTSAGPRVQMDPVGISSLCTLAFFGSACEPEKGRYGGVLARAMDYLLSRQMPNGDYAPNDLIGGYNRPVTLQAYAEAANVTHDPQYLPFVQRGADFLACIQASKGGWRYRVVDNANDTSVVAWVLFGAKSAETAGARVRTSVYEGCDLVLSGYQVRPLKEREDYVRDIDPNYAFEVGLNTDYEFHTGYQNSNFDRKYATTGLGLMSRVLLGFRRSHPFCIGSANKLLKEQVPEIPKDGKWEKLVFKQEYPMYHLYYGTLSMHQMGGRYFRNWNKVSKEILTGTQDANGCSAGSWPGWNIDTLFSRLYTTAIGALTLETVYRYAPILQD